MERIIKSNEQIKGHFIGFDCKLILNRFKIFIVILINIKSVQTQNGTEQLSPKAKNKKVHPIQWGIQRLIHFLVINNQRNHTWNILFRIRTKIRLLTAQSHNFIRIEIILSLNSYATERILYCRNKPMNTFIGLLAKFIWIYDIINNRWTPCKLVASPKDIILISYGIFCTQTHRKYFR